MLTFDFGKRHYTTQWWSKDLEQIDKEFESTGYTTVEILSILKGKPWGPMALSLVLSEKPSCLRVTEGMISLDGASDRITVHVNADGLIRRIEKEISVRLPDGFRYGADVSEWIRDHENYVPK